MMKVDFDRLIDRSKTNDIKWNADMLARRYNVDLRPDFIPMWVADMDFAAAPCIKEAIEKRAEQEIYGYCSPREKYFDSLSYWYDDHYGWRVDAEWVCPIPSVVGGINVSIRAFTNPGDGVIIQQPVYDPFASLISLTKRKIVNNSLVFEEGKYRMDYELLEKQAADPNNKLLILCSPHNPIGRVWSRQELATVDEICRRNGVVVVSDEIHSDIIYSGHTHTPFSLLNEDAKNNTILCTSPAKTFNIPGLKMANIIICNAALREKFLSEQLALSLDIKHIFGIEAVAAAYSPEGKAWLQALLPYLEENALIVEDTVNGNWEGVNCVKPEGSFLCWLDFRNTGLSEEEITKRFLEAGVICTHGSWFGEDGTGFMRLNIACPRSRLLDALNRIKGAIK